MEPFGSVYFYLQLQQIYLSYTLLYEIDQPFFSVAVAGLLLAVAVAGVVVRVVLVPAGGVVGTEAEAKHNFRPSFDQKSANFTW